MKKAAILLVIFLLTGMDNFAQMAVNSDFSGPDPSAMLDVKSTGKGLLIPRMSSAERNNIVSPTEGLMVFCTDCGVSGYAELTIYKGGSWFTISKQADWSCGQPFSIIHSAGGGVAPVNKATTYGTVTNIPGEPAKCWITSNLGADNQASSATDATEASAGWYWQFNRPQGYKHDGTICTPAWAIISIVEYSDWLPDNDPCRIELGKAWRVPVYTEWNNVDNVGGWNSLTDAWNSGLKLHAAGEILFSAGLMYWRGSDGYYWSSTTNSANDGWCMVFSGGYSAPGHYKRAYGFSVRCLRD
jgi:hypothetical protein